MRRFALLSLCCGLVTVAFVIALMRMPFASQAQGGTTVTDCSTDSPLRRAIEEAPETGWYYPVNFDCGKAVIHLSAPLSITSEIDLDGGGLITLSADNVTHHFDVVVFGYVQIRGISLVDGYALNTVHAITPTAASIVNHGALQLTNVTIANSRAEGPLSAGGIANFASLIGDNLRFENLEGGSAGAIYDLGGTSIQNSTFANNRGGESGVVVSLGSTGFGDSIFRNNVGENGSGVMTLKVITNPPEGVYPRSWGSFWRSSLIQNKGGNCAATSSQNGNLTITYSTVASNTTTSGGAICIKGNNAGLSNIVYSTISGNHTAEPTLDFTGNHSLWMANVTIAGNDTDNSYGAALLAGSDVFLDARNLIIATSGQQGCVLRNPGRQGFASSILPDASCMAPYPYQDVYHLPLSIVADPLLGPLSDNGGLTLTHLPAAESPAKGIGVYCWDTDQRLVPRWQDTCDAGSVEIEQRPIQARLPVVLYQNWPLPTPAWTPQP